MSAAEWRVKEGAASVLIVTEAGTVQKALQADPVVLKEFLTTLDGLTRFAETAPTNEQTHPSDWGDLVMRRAQTGEILWVDPKLFWDGIYFWFRSRGVDYDS